MNLVWVVTGIGTTRGWVPRARVSTDRPLHCEPIFLTARLLRVTYHDSCDEDSGLRKTTPVGLVLPHTFGYSQPLRYSRRRSLFAASSPMKRSFSPSHSRLRPCFSEIMPSSAMLVER